jgi:very-short-patch-repair endonuclease
MARTILQWLAARQHGVVSRPQLLALGFSSEAIDHRIEKGFLHPLFRGVYAVGRREVSHYGMWMAAALACGPEAALSHDDAAALWRMRASSDRVIHVSVPLHVARRHPGIRVHRRSVFEVTRHRGIPVTTPAATIVDLAGSLPPAEIEAVINEADVRRILTVRDLRAAVDDMSTRPGLAKLKRTVDQRTFTFTRSALERAFLPIARRAGLPKPLTRAYVNGYEVDFYWPELKLVVETDGGTYHRMPAQQRADRRRDHAHIAARLTPLRFTHGQIRYEPSYVLEFLTTVADRRAPA